MKDGDTIELLLQGRPLRVRLLGVDAPEKKQPFGTKAKDFTASLCFGKTVRLVTANTDRYGRTVGTIYLPDGRSLNEELVKNGYAWHYKAYSKDQRLAELQNEARANRRGLWVDVIPTPPWEFRHPKKVAQNQVPLSFPDKPNPGQRTDQSNMAQAVWICTSKSVKTYHIQKDCSALNRCGKQKVQTKLQEALSQGKTNRCKVCG